MGSSDSGTDLSPVENPGEDLLDGAPSDGESPGQFIHDNDLIGAASAESGAEGEGPNEQEEGGQENAPNLDLVGDLGPPNAPSENADTAPLSSKRSKRGRHDKQENAITNSAARDIFNLIVNSVESHSKDHLEREPNDGTGFANSEIAWSEHRRTTDYDQIKIDESLVADVAIKAASTRVVGLTSACHSVLEATAFAVATQLRPGTREIRVVDDLTPCLGTRGREPLRRAAERLLDIAQGTVLVVHVPPDHVDGSPESGNMSRLESLVQLVRSGRNRVTGAVIFILFPPTGWRSLVGRPVFAGDTPIVDVDFVEPLVRGKWGDPAANELVQNFQQQRSNGQFRDDYEVANHILFAIAGDLKEARELALHPSHASADKASDAPLAANMLRPVEQAVLAITSNIAPISVSQLERLLRIVLTGKTQEVPWNPRGPKDEHDTLRGEATREPVGTSSMDAWEYWDANAGLVKREIGLRAITSADGSSLIDFQSIRERRRASEYVEPRIVLRCLDEMIASRMSRSHSGSAETRRTVLAVLKRLVDQHPDHFTVEWLYALVRGQRGSSDRTPHLPEPPTEWNGLEPSERLATIERVELAASAMVTHSTTSTALKEAVEGITKSGAVDLSLALCEALALIESFDVLSELKRISRKDHPENFESRAHQLLRARCTVGFDSTHDVLSRLREWLPAHQKPIEAHSLTERFACEFLWRFVISSTDRYHYRSSQGKDAEYALFESTNGSAEHPPAERARLVGAFFTRASLYPVLHLVLGSPRVSEDPDEQLWQTVAVVGHLLERWERVFDPENPMRAFLGELMVGLERPIARRLPRFWRGQSTFLLGEMSRVRREIRDGTTPKQVALERIQTMRSQRQRLSRLVNGNASAQR